MSRITQPIHDIATALALLTRIPIRARFDRTAQASWAWPLVGLPVALLAWALGMAALATGLPPTVAAGVVLAAQMVLTGAMHEDGLADCADGFWGGFDRDRRLAIMRDSQVGSYGVLALILSLGLRWAALVPLVDPGPWRAGAALLAVSLLSRAAMLGVAASLPHARDDGLSKTTGRPTPRAALVGIVLAVAITVAALGAPALAPIAAATLAAALAALIARAKIGGQTGDVLGATQQLAELAALAALCATLP
ncbi:cobalamin-5'-phosphate synthase [Palleronia salina]|uniref:Adenosylcobinamide-GDP ribazoletransferase n=1 Tax=Palleronia salina TaxID=313368 RepID=A0A1M6JD85_9RHOB|nr:adenosylcobinamide-GDP ribazoletransferase [Palleronia salina]SHJ44691.1 cobalamin-5'-phosphate synthase [Palleronia salina]